MDSFVPMAGLAATVFTVVNLVRYVRGKDWNGAATIGTVWLSGIVVLALFARMEWADMLDPGLTGGIPLSELGWASIVVLGLQVGSAATAFNEVRAGLDTAPSKRKPPILPSSD